MKTIYISGEIGWEVTADSIREQVDSKSKEKLRVIINSIGGYVSDGFEIFNILKAYQGEIEIVVGVMAASVASYIAMVAPLENRKGFKNSSFMVHEASRSAYGRARDFLTYAERLEGLNNIIASEYADGIGIKKDAAREMMIEDKYFTGWESLVENNIISDVIDLDDVEIPQKEEDEDGFLFFELLKGDLQKDTDMKSQKELMYSSEEKINSDIKKSQNDLQKAAAKLEIKPEPNEPDDNNSQGDNMNLQDFLKTNPEAMAEYNEALNSAKADGVGDVKAQIQTDRERLAKVLKLEGVNLSASAEAAIIGDTAIVDFLEAKLEEQSGLRSGEKKSPFSDIVTGQTPGEQDKGGAEEQAKNGAVKDEDFDKLLEAHKEKRNGGKK